MLIGCTNNEVLKSSTYDKSYNEATDFNVSAISWMQSPCSIAEAPNGFYFIYRYFLYYYDLSTMKLISLCDKVNCNHYKETDPERVPECDSFIGNVPKPFVGVSGEKLYATIKDTDTSTVQLVEMNLDGSGRKICISDCSQIDTALIRIHRGILYYPYTSYDLDGKVTHNIEAMSLMTKDHQKRTVFSTTEPDIIFSQIVPYGNNVYFEYYKIIDTTNAFYASIGRYCIIDGKITMASQDDGFQIYGACSDQVILTKLGGYYCIDNYNSEIDIKEYDSGISKFAEAHPLWNCHPDCINESLVFFSCFDKSENVDDFIHELLVVNQQGEVVCEIPDEAWGTDGAQVIGYGTENYIIKYAALPTSAEVVVAYRFDDLYHGQANKITILNGGEIGSGSYITKY